MKGRQTAHLEFSSVCITLIREDIQGFSEFHESSLASANTRKRMVVTRTLKRNNPTSFLSATFSVRRISRPSFDANPETFRK